MSGYTIGEIGIWLALAAGLGFVLGWLVRELVQRSRPMDAPEPEPEPAPEPATKTKTKPAPEPPAIVPGPHVGSALPLADGAPPSADHIIKVSRSSKIYHPPASPAYARTTAAWWFTNADDAEAAGFRRPKNG